ncbi:MAG: lipoate--protein ligase family protein [Thermincolia bacterium]
MDKWRLVVSEPLSGAMNMALDEAVMLAVSRGLAPPTIRFYQWSPAAVTLGYFQSLAKEIDQQACQQAGIDIVRRLTGGRAVLHHQEFTYSLVTPEGHPKVAGPVLQSYLFISRGLLEGLTRLGVKAELTAGTRCQEHNSAACFDAPSWYELGVEGKKLAGSAQTRRHGCFLQHGSIPVQNNPDSLFSILRFPSEEVRARAKAFFMAKTTSLDDILGYRPDFAKVSEGFAQGLAAGLGITLEEQRLLPEEIAWAEDLCLSKYCTNEWNGRK